MLTHISIFVLSAMIGIAPLPAWSSETHSPVIVHAELEEQCKSLAIGDFSGVEDAPTQITQAELREAKRDVPAYCHVQGYVAPQVGFDVRLPVENWNGKFLQVGCGGFCGVLFSEWGGCDDGLRRGYACLSSDLGHKSRLEDAGWAFNNLQAEMDFGYRATHVATLAGKALTERFYAQSPKRSYFMGCSTGGKQGLMEAQRFPWDFDGIVAGAPAIHELGGAMTDLWVTLAFLDKGGAPLLSPKEFTLIHKAVLEACDMNDGVRDGLIGDPRYCPVDLSKLKCESNNKDACLTSLQLEAARKIYSGPVTVKGDRLSTGGVALGSELQWPTVGSGLMSIGGFLNYLTEQFRYTAFFPDSGPGWKISDFDFDRDYRRLDLMEPLYSPTNPDLRRFKAAGGKLIHYHGWSDFFVMPTDSIDYYETVEKTMGSRSATQDFYRLFMLPGVAHCGGGQGADSVDYLSYIEAWVERNEAPNSIVGAHIKSDAAADRRVPLNPQKVTFTRPVYPYPQRAIYGGTGDPNDAANFRPAQP